MKSDIHPNYRPVVFKDKTADFAILTQSTINTKETIKWEDGNEYPVYFVDISSASHPFYTGKQQYVDTMGRVEKFKKSTRIDSYQFGTRETVSTTSTVFPLQFHSTEHPVNHRSH
jgi:large subunit ribosomal protein L31